MPDTLLGRSVILHDPPIRGTIILELGKMRFVVKADRQQIECHRADFRLPPLMQGWPSGYMSQPWRKL